MNKSIIFLEEIDNIAQKEIPEEVLKRAKRSLLDYLAVTCAGVKFQVDKLQRYYSFTQPEEGKFRAVGTGKDLATAMPWILTMVLIRESFTLEVRFFHYLYLCLSDTKQGLTIC